MQLGIVSAVAVACFVNILPNDFCYDDVPVVRDNPKIQGEDQWAAVWGTDYWSQSGQRSSSRDLLYRPVTLSLLRLTRMTAGPSPLPFHVVSLLLHAGCSLLVVLLVRTLFSGCGESGDHASGGTSDSSSFEPHAILPLSTGLLFAVLPIHSEVVASVVGQSDMLATGGVVGAFLCHFRAVWASSKPAKLRWKSAAALLAFLAMGAKESGICVVSLIFLAELLGIPRAPEPGAGRLTTHLRKQQRPLTLPVLGTRAWRTAYLVLPLVAYLFLRYEALLGNLHQAPAPTRTVNVLVDAPPWQHALGVMQAWGMYLAKTIFPRVLAIEYAINSVRLAGSPLQFHVLLGFLWTITLSAIAVTGWRSRQRELVFLVLALIVSYLPTSNAIVLIQVFFAERIWYLPSVFFVCLFAYGLRQLLNRRAWRGIGLAFLVAMMLRCLVRNNDWRNNGTLFAAAYYDHPASVMARHLYGQWLTQNGQLDEGISLLRKAIEIDLGFTDAQRSLGLAYLNADQPEPALRHLQIVEMQAPGHPLTRSALAEATSRLDQEHRQQLAQLSSDAQQNPADVEKNLAYVRQLRELGQTTEALRLLEQAVSPIADSPDWIAETAITLVFLDRRDDAIIAYRRALTLEPEHAQRCVELAMLLLERRAPGDLDEATTLTDRARKSSPYSPQVFVALAEIEALKGNRKGAEEAFQEALRRVEPQSEYARIIRERQQSLGL